MKALLLVLLLAQPAAACAPCGFEMLNCSIPFYFDWVKILALWFGLAVLIRLVTGSVTPSERRNTYIWAAVLFFGMIMVTPILLLGLMVWWFVAYVKLWRSERGRPENLLLTLNHLTAIALCVAAVSGLTHKLTTPDLEYRMSRLHNSAAAYGLRTSIVGKRLLTPEELIRLALEGDEWQRSNAIKIMGRYDDPAFIPLLIEKLEDPALGEAARESLQELTGEKLRTPARWRKWLQEAKDETAPASP